MRRPRRPRFDSAGGGREEVAAELPVRFDSCGAAPGGGDSSVSTSSVTAVVDSNGASKRRGKRESGEGACGRGGAGGRPHSRP